MSQFEIKYPEITRDIIYQFASGYYKIEPSLEKIYKKFGDYIYSIFIQKLIGQKFTPEEAKKIWEGILRHKSHLRMLLKRDVKLEVAALDYFTSISALIEEPIIVEEKIFNGLREKMMVDELTGLYNYRYFKQRLEEEFSYAKRYNQIFSIAIFDIDDFKNYNDKYGHLKGNELLCQLSKIIKKRIRKCDIPCRYGGDEFVIILPHTNKKGAFIFSENLRSIIVKSEFNGIISLSGGIATFPTDTDKSAEDLFNYADKALYRAKFEGKNRICAFPKERREFKRISLKGKRISFDILEPKLLEGKIKELKDISPGGIAFYSDTAFPSSQYIEMKISSKFEVIKFKGYVVWCNKMDNSLYEVGVKFIEISKETAKIIKGMD